MITQNTITSTLIGGPTLLFDYAGIDILTDPTFDGPGEYQLGPITLHKLAGPAIAPGELGHVSLVLLSHDQHPDNLDRAGREFLGNSRTVLSTPDAAGRIPGVIGLAPWQSTTVESLAGTITVTAVPAQHGPESVAPMTGSVTGFVLQAAGWPDVYVSGDNTSTSLVAAIAEHFPQIRIAILFAGAATLPARGPSPLTFDSDGVTRSARLLPGAVIVPVHISDWGHILEPAAMLVDRVEPYDRDRVVFLHRGLRTQLWSGIPLPQADLPVAAQ